MKVSTGYPYCRELSFSQYISNNRGANMKTAYKLTDSKMRTYNGFQWELGKWYETTGKGKLCSSSWLHFYNNPLVGMFLNLTYVNIGNSRLFRAEVEGNFIDDNGLKCGYSRARLIEELPVPQISPVQRVRFAILCAKEVYKEKKWNEWADNWLSGKDRTKESTESIESTFSAAEITAELGFYVTKNEESAFYATKSAESAFYATKSAESAFYAAISAESAVELAFYTTESKKINLIRIARKAMEE